MLEPRVAAQLEAAALDLHAGARSHKRASDTHRKQARDLMASFERIRAQLAEHGITLRIQEATGERKP